MIRSMVYDDIPFVHALEMETFGKSLEKDMLYGELSHNDLAHYFIYEETGKRLGYAGMRIMFPNAEIMNIAVVKHSRQKGAGTALMRHLIEVCKTHGVRALTLEVRKDNDEAIRFYEGFDFETITTRNDYYQDGTDALLMMKKVGV